ncbi:WGR domain-containing protein [Geotalea toluenoxydans]|uniref:WGR domain-containing protein n=1 Tax=Geotalea toluenoxydans TaxID=421624 RepID=UPI0006D077E8|nr:WGR domain-containing protein [Geotalea toluenoxydans]
MLERTIPEEKQYQFTGPGHVYLELIDLTRNSKKWYSIELLQDQDGFAIRRSWGRIGKHHQTLNTIMSH